MKTILQKLYDELIKQAKIKDAMKIHNFVAPNYGSNAPVSSYPTIPELVLSNLPVSVEDEQSEDTVGNDELNSVYWRTAIQAAHTMLHAMSYISDDTSEFKTQCRKMIGKFSRIVRQSSTQRSLDDLLHTRKPIAADIALRSGVQPTFEDFRVVNHSMYITAQLRNSPLVPITPTNESINLTNEVTIADRRNPTSFVNAVWLPT